MTSRYDLSIYVCFKKNNDMNKDFIFMAFQETNNLEYIEEEFETNKVFI